MTRLAGFALVPFLLFASFSSPVEFAPSGFTVETVAPGVYTIHHELPDDVDGNSTLVVGRDAALVVDTNYSPAAARAVLAEVRRLTDRPVRFVLNTHWHYDHLFGNQVYQDAFPGVQFIAHEETARIIDTWASKYPDRVRPQLPAAREASRARAETGKAADGTPLSEAEHRLAVDEYAHFDEQVQRFTEERFVKPTITFHDRMTVNLGDRVVEIFNFGRGNTPGDAVAWAPDTRTLVTGDLVVAPTPFAPNSYPLQWTRVMRRLLQFDAAAIVPGHGPVMHDKVYVQQVLELLEYTVAEVQKAEDAGMNLEQTRTAVSFDKWRDRFAGTDPRLRLFFDDYWVTPVVERAWRELRGEF